MEFTDEQQAVLRTLLYSDIFAFPLTEEELWLGLLAHKKMDRDLIRKTLRSLSEFISCERGFYCLKGKEKIINRRKRGMKIAQAKLRIAIRVAKHLSYIPSILFIGVSGKLSHIDADNDDDIDIFVVTKKNTIWVTRLLLLAVLELMNVRRKSSDTDAKNKICPNLIIEESVLLWEKQDPYTAHEIVNMLPLFVRNNIYRNFLSKNAWVNRFYPNRKGKPPADPILKVPKQYITIKTISYLLTLPIFEFLFCKLQRLYMKNKKTNEVVLSNFMAFHPHDYREEILNNFASKTRKYGILTN